MRPAILVLCALVGVGASVSSAEARIFGRHRGGHGSCGGNGSYANNSSNEAAPVRSIRISAAEMDEVMHRRWERSREFNQAQEVEEVFSGQRKDFDDEEPTDDDDSPVDPMVAMAIKLNQIEARIQKSHKTTKRIHAQTTEILQRLDQHLAAEQAAAAEQALAQESAAEAAQMERWSKVLSAGIKGGMADVTEKLDTMHELLKKIEAKE